MKTRNSHGLLQLHVGREALAYCQCLYRENKALFVGIGGGGGGVRGSDLQAQLE